MTKQKKEQFIDMGRAESEIFEPTEEVRSEFAEAAQLGASGGSLTSDPSVVEELEKAVGLN
jgi:hypothetical protein